MTRIKGFEISPKYPTRPSAPALLKIQHTVKAKAGKSVETGIDNMEIEDLKLNTEPEHFGTFFKM